MKNFSERKAEIKIVIKLGVEREAWVATADLHKENFRSGSAKLSKVQQGSVRFSKVQQGLARFRKVQQGSARFSKVQQGSARLSKVGACKENVLLIPPKPKKWIYTKRS